MKCEKCGAETRDSSVYCPNCGVEMKFTERKSLPIIGVINKSKVIKLSIISTVILAIIAGTIVTIYILFGGAGFSEPEDCIGGYWEAIGECNASELINCVPDDYLNELLEERNIKKSEFEKYVDNYISDIEYRDDDGNKFDYKYIDSVSIIYKDTERCSKSELKELKSKITQSFDFRRDEFDTSYIDDIVTVTANVALYDKNEDKLTKYDKKGYTCIKYKDRWYLTSVMEILLDIALEK